MALSFRTDTWLILVVLEDGGVSVYNTHAQLSVEHPSTTIPIYMMFA